MIRLKPQGPAGDLRALPEDEQAVVRRMHAFLDSIAAIEDSALQACISHFRNLNPILAQYGAAKGHLSHVPDLSSTVGLDFACWCGFTTFLMKELGAKTVYGTDVIESFTAAAEKWRKHRGEEGLAFRHNPIDQIPFESETFDWIVVSGLYTNLNPSATAGIFSEWNRVLKPGGLVLFHDGSNPRHAPTRERLIKQQRNVELGEGSAEAPAGMFFQERRKIIQREMPSLAPGEAADLARGTCYQWRPGLLSALKSYRDGGAMPRDFFRAGDYSRPPVDPQTGNAAARMTDPWIIREELTAAGFGVRFTKGAGGPFLAEKEMKSWYETTPAVFVVAKKGK